MFLPNVDPANRRDRNGMNEKYFETLFLDCDKDDEFPKTFAILTAFNPMDQSLGNDLNKKRNLELFQILGDRGKTFARVTGSSPDHSHQEPSFLVHCSRQDALELGTTFRQRAIFWVNDDQLEIIECSTGISHSAGSFRNRIKKEKS